MAIHQTGLVHGELGPDHVVLGPDGPRLTHFGITPPYGAATPAADLLAWADTVIFAAVGRPPAGPQDLAALPEDLREVVAACLAPDPAGRPVARAVLTRLLSGHDLSSGLLAEGTRQARAAARVPESSPGSPGSPRRSGPASGVVLWAVACAVCVLAIAAGAVFIFRPHHGRAAAQPGAPATATSRVERHHGCPGRCPRPALPASLTGSWAGPIHQTNPVLTVSVRISLPARSATGTISYPSLGCSGKLAIVSVAERQGHPGPDHQQRAERTAPTASSRMVSGPAGTVAFTFLRPGGGNPTGTLTRSCLGQAGLTDHWRRGPDAGPRAGRAAGRTAPARPRSPAPGWLARPPGRPAVLRPRWR